MRQKKQKNTNEDQFRKKSLVVRQTTNATDEDEECDTRRRFPPARKRLAVNTKTFRQASKSDCGSGKLSILCQGFCCRSRPGPIVTFPEKKIRREEEEEEDKSRDVC